MKIGICTFEQYHGKKEIGSSRIRGHWIAKAWGEDCEIYKTGRKYDVLIFQKVYWSEMAKSFKGIKILDMCDADWLEWGPKIFETAQYCDYITTSSLELAKFMVKNQDTPVAFIADRIDFDELPSPKKHSGELKKIAWYGYSSNFEVLYGALPAIKKRGLELTVISNNVFRLPTGMTDIEITNLPFNPKTIYDDLQRSDAVLNPKLKTGRFKYKSNNKDTLPWALGLPSIENEKEFDDIIDGDKRQEVSDRLYRTAKEEYDISLSVRDLKDIIKDIDEQRTTRKTNTENDT